ncbi:MAG: lysoplasmalogenase [Acidobacteria bacterium]|nr:lysoplasmalogenase [Acidobacteriota bacterium]
MDPYSFSTLLASVSLAGSVAYVIARWKDNEPAAAIAKTTASTAFVALAFVSGATGSTYGVLIIAALIFSWVGDVLLLSLKSSFLLAGIGSFFIAHIIFAAAFTINDLNPRAFIVTLAATAVLGGFFLRWLWKYLRSFYRAAVPLYLVAISIMVSLAIAAVFEAAPPSVAVGAVAFAVSDISVARDRFVERSIANKAWGLPLYYLAQILFAASVTR